MAMYVRPFSIIIPFVYSWNGVQNLLLIASIVAFAEPSEHTFQEFSHYPEYDDY